MSDWSDSTKKEFLESWTEVHEPTPKKLTNKTYQVMKGGDMTADMLMWDHMSEQAELEQYDLQQENKDLLSQLEHLKNELINQAEYIDTLEDRGKWRSDELRLKNEIIKLHESEYVK